MNQPTPSLTSFVAADRAVKRAGNEGAEKRLRHYDATENKRPATTEMNESGKKTTPRTAQAIANKKSERN